MAVNQYKTSTIKYTNENCQMEKKQVVSNKDDGAIIKESVWVDKGNSGTFDSGELASITIFGYTKDGKYATSRTYTDIDGDGYSDCNVDIKYYTKQNSGEYRLDYITDMGEPTIEQIEKDYSYPKGSLSKEMEEEVQKIKEREILIRKMQYKNDNYEHVSDVISTLLQTEYRVL